MHVVLKHNKQCTPQEHTVSNSMMSLVEKPISMSNDIALQMRIEDLNMGVHLRRACMA
jgi:hypothetical protein